MSGSRVAGLQGSRDGVGGSNRIAVWFYGKVARERVIVLIYQSERKYAQIFLGVESSISVECTSFTSMV
jgi:hypothetical protein